MPIPHSSIDSSDAKCPPQPLNEQEEHTQIVTSLQWDYRCCLWLIQINRHCKIQGIVNCCLAPVHCGLLSAVGVCYCCVHPSRFLFLSLSLGRKQKYSAIPLLVLVGLNFSPHSVISCFGRDLASPSLVFRPLCHIISFINKPSPTLTLA